MRLKGELKEKSWRTEDKLKENAKSIWGQSRIGTWDTNIFGAWEGMMRSIVDDDRVSYRWWDCNEAMIDWYKTRNQN